MHTAVLREIHRPLSPARCSTVTTAGVFLYSFLTNFCVILHLYLSFDIINTVNLSEDVATNHGA